MARDEPPRLCTARYHEIQNACWSAKVQVHPKILEKVPLAWDYDVSTEDALIEAFQVVHTYLEQHPMAINHLSTKLKSIKKI
jgi:hypothetical protein